MPTISAKNVKSVSLLNIESTKNRAGHSCCVDDNIMSHVLCALGMCISISEANMICNSMHSHDTIY